MAAMCGFPLLRGWNGGADTREAVRGVWFDRTQGIAGLHAALAGDCRMGRHMGATGGCGRAYSVMRGCWVAGWYGRLHQQPIDGGLQVR
ncbi:hypothetical protein DSC_01310 [Pseudoxanthomonas spadix BD-a59]|uniref:Uncharacterized protein n=1 Tax=Pseudoxanthomonas spadix (strain BD-a59) TaxID=1045855 RepID=G7UTL4_PSEUP|nr:hypothetical protein DSC_01310 [Pseudoxanthomonas spadix BD-a59]